ncbi:MAG: hypothetical protein U5K43_11095 [Halofilum sp. (in: g-proteobacteria)]|nr:hypothetical protein [Halofilum sp. (in: g-proteobacteria)]
MNCNSCHNGTNNVPNFTHTGRRFSMAGYTQPNVRGELRHPGNQQGVIDSGTRGEQPRRQLPGAQLEQLLVDAVHLRHRERGRATRT